MSASPRSVPWLRGPLRHHLNKICTLRRRYARSPSSSLWVKLTDSELAFSNAFHEAKLNYEEDLVSDHGPNHTKLYCYMRSMSKSRDIPETLQFGPECVSEDRAKATLINKYFFSVFTSSSFEFPQMEGCSSPPALLASIICSEE